MTRIRSDLKLMQRDAELPLVTIHHEAVDPDVCFIGKVRGVNRSHLSLLEVDPDAEWDEEPTRYRLSEITRVGFGADYENALHLVAGEPGRAKRRS